jgi:hypothetical protein
MRRSSQRRGCLRKNPRRGFPGPALFSAGIPWSRAGRANQERTCCIIAPGRIFVRSGCGRVGSAVKFVRRIGRRTRLAGRGVPVRRQGPPIAPSGMEPAVVPSPKARLGRVYFTAIITASVRTKSKSPLFSCGRANARKASEPLRSIDISSRLAASPTFC